MAIDYRTTQPRWKREAELTSRRGASSRSQSGRELPVDKVMLVIVLTLTLFGAVMVYSASAMLAEKNYGSQFFFLYRQGGWAIAGLVAMAVAMCIDYRHYRRPAVVFSLLGVTLVMLVVVLFLPKVNETHRWIRYGPVSLQPSEVSKLALIAFLAFFLESRAKELEGFKQVFLPAALVAGMVIALVAAEPDLGTAMALGVVFVAMMFQAGVPARYLATLAVPVSASIGWDVVVRAVATSKTHGFHRPLEEPDDFRVPGSSIADCHRKRRGERFRLRARQAEAFLPACAAHRFHIRSHRRRAWLDWRGGYRDLVRAAGVERIPRGAICA